MGDLNDEPDDQSVAEILKAAPAGTKPQAGELYNLFSKHYAEGEGTLWYRDWDLFDHIIVSGNLLNKKKRNRPVIRKPYGNIFNPDWLLYENKYNETVPFRSYRGEYLGGYSDHLPVYTILEY